MTVSTKTEADNYGQFSHRSPEVEIKNDTFPPKKIYTRYGDIILDQIMDPGEFRFVSDDESLQIDQPWEGVLIFQTMENGFDKIEFYDKEHYLIKTLILKSLNPYTKVKYPLLSNKLGFNSDAESILTNIMDNPSSNVEVTEYRTSAEVYPQDDYFRNIKNTNKHIVLLFELISILGDNVVDWECSIIVLDSLGNKTGSLENIKYDCAYPKVTNDGRQSVSKPFNF